MARAKKKPPGAVDTAVRLACDKQGLVWYAEPGAAAVGSGLSADDFLAGPAYARAETVRVVATAANVPLIVKLYARRCNQELASLQVCSPLVADTAALRADARRLLDAAADWREPPSRGGWQELTEPAWASYAMASRLLQGEANVVEGMLCLHPAWPALSFLPHINVMACCKLLALILDPRFYVAADKPDSTGKLQAFLGLDPRAMSGGSTKRPHYRQKECKLVLDAWKAVKPTDILLLHPGNFLWRYWAARCPAAKADLRTSQRFLEFLRGVWLDGLTPGRPEPLFVPEHFFVDEPGTAAAYRSHVARLRQQP